MKTNLDQLLFLTQEQAQKLLDVNDPGYTVIVEDHKAKVLDRAGVVVAELAGDNVTRKVLL